MQRLWLRNTGEETVNQRKFYYFNYSTKSKAAGHTNKGRVTITGNNGCHGFIII